MSVTAQEVKVVRVIDPAAIVDNVAFTTQEVDTLGFEYAQFYVYLGATDIAVALFAAQESDVSGSGFADIVGTRFGTDNNTGGSASTLPSDSDDNALFCVEFSLTGRKRFLDLTLTAGNGAAGTFAAAWCVLSRGLSVPHTAAERGCSQIMRV